MSFSAGPHHTSALSSQVVICNIPPACWLMLISPHQSSTNGLCITGTAQPGADSVRWGEICSLSLFAVLSSHLIRSNSWETQQWSVTTVCVCVCVLYLLPETLDTILVTLDMGVHTSTHTYLHIYVEEHTHTHLAESDMPIPHGSAVPYPALSTSSSASDIILLTDSRDMCGVNGSEPDRYWERRYRRLY